MPPYLAFHLQKLFLLKLYIWHKSVKGTPASAFFEILIIWLSLNRDRFKWNSPFAIVPEKPTYARSYFR